MSSLKFIGQRIARIEDDALLRGTGRFVDDIRLPGTLEAAFVRSGTAHARIVSIDAAAARASPGVHAVLTYQEIRPLLTQDRLPLELRLDPLPPDITPYPLAKDEVVFAGGAIAVVIASSRFLAEDAAALVVVDLEPLPAISDCLDALSRRSAGRHTPDDDHRQGVPSDDGFLRIFLIAAFKCWSSSAWSDSRRTMRRSSGTTSSTTVRPVPTSCGSAKSIRVQIGRLLEALCLTVHAMRTAAVARSWGAKLKAERAQKTACPGRKVGRLHR